MSSLTSHAPQGPDRIILVPGFGLGGTELLPLAARLRRRGYRVSVFWHFTGRLPLAESARRLWAKARAEREDVIHFVGHSLGGLVVLRMLSDHRWDRPGRVVTIGTPHAGLSAARRLAALPAGRRLLGPEILAAADGQPIPVSEGRELGVLAGNRRRFYGSWMVPNQPSDTVIGVMEARHPGSQAHATLPETHVSMLLATQVVSHIDVFLRQGTFADANG